MAPRLLLYGATGYTGRLIAAGLLAAGLRPVLAGRDQERLAALAAAAGLEHRRARLDDPEELAAALSGVVAVLHAAGPFSATARPMVEACLARGVHYLDISAEARVIEGLAAFDAAARARGIMVMPAVGFDVVPSDCLCAHVARRLPGAERLEIGLTGLGLVTRGSARTLLEAWDQGLVRRAGTLVPTPLGILRRSFDFGRGPRACVNVTWGDVATAYYTTGIPNVETYCEANPILESALLASRSPAWSLAAPLWRQWLRLAAGVLPDGPSPAERDAAEMIIVAEASDAAGRRVRARLRTPEAYTFTATAAVAVARRVLDGDVEAGFQTPGRVYGSDFVCQLAGAEREDLD